MTEREKKQRIAELRAELRELEAVPQSDWHAGFEALLRIETHKYGDKVHITTEEAGDEQAHPCAVAGTSTSCASDIGEVPPRTDFVILVKGEIAMKDVLMEMVKDRVDERVSTAKAATKQETLVSSIKNVMANLKLTLVQAMDALSIPQSQRDTYASLV